MIQKAKVTSVIGNPKSEGAVSMIAIHNLEIPYRFPASVVKEAEAAGEVQLKGREDWRHIPLIRSRPSWARLSPSRRLWLAGRGRPPGPRLSRRGSRGPL